MKHSKVDLGQIEALLNIIGGEIGLQALLSNAGELKAFTPEQRRQLAFLQSYEKAVTLRNLLRGWDKYGSKDGVSHFAIMISHLTHRARNFAESAIHSNQPLEDHVQRDLIDQIEAIKLKVVEFQTREGITLTHLWWLDEIKNGLRRNDPLKVFQFACALNAYVQGTEALNDLFLAPVDEVDK